MPPPTRARRSRTRSGPRTTPSIPNGGGALAPPTTLIPHGPRRTRPPSTSTKFIRDEAGALAPLVAQPSGLGQGWWGGTCPPGGAPRSELFSPTPPAHLRRDVAIRPGHDPAQERGDGDSGAGI